MDRPLKEYVEQIHRIAQDVLNAWNLNAKAGNARTVEFKALLEKCLAYNDAKKIADYHRKIDVLTEQEAFDEKETREAFAIEYKRFHEEREVVS